MGILGERVPYSGRRPAGREDALSISREDCPATPLSGKESEVDYKGKMTKYGYSLQ